MWPFDLRGYEQLVLEGFLLSIQLALVSLGFGLLLGFLGAAAKLSRFAWLRGGANAVTNVVRGVPELLVLFLVYFGGQQLLAALLDTDVAINSFAAGVVALSVIFGAYASETIRGAFLAVPLGQIEAARAYGMTSRQVFFRVQLPQLWRYALPGLGNLWLVLTKDTSLVSLIGLQDLARNSYIGANRTKLFFNFYFTAALLYLAITIASIGLQRLLERRVSRGVRRA